MRKCLLLLTMVIFVSMITPLSFAQRVIASDSSAASPVSNDSENEASAETGKTSATDDSGSGSSEKKKKVKKVKKLAVVNTAISGFGHKFTRSYRGSVKEKITIKPAYGRKLILKRYDPYQKKWITEREIKTPNKKKAKITIKFTGTWRAYPMSKWKLVAPMTKQKEVKGRQIAPMKRASTKTTRVSVRKFHNARYAIIYDASTGKCLYTYNATSGAHIASMRKMMAGVLLDENKKPDDRITVRELNRNTITLGLRSGDVVRAKDLMHAMFLPSANDAASATAAGVGGTHSRFIKMMNAKARKLGMKRTKYSSPVGDGLTNKYKTTMYDQALLGKYIMTSATTKYLRTVLKKKSYSFTSLKYGRHYSMKAGNKLLGTRYHSIGIKTGYNSAAKWCFCNAWRYKGRLYISVVSGNPTRAKRWDSVRALTNFTKYAVKHKQTEIVVKE